MNQYLGIGNLTREPQLTKKDDTTYCNFTVAVNNRHDDTSFVDVVAFNKQAEACAKHLIKGSKVCIRGIAEPRAYLDKAGNPRAVLKVKIKEIDFLAKTKPRTEQPDADLSVEVAD